jgi:hypothetical protein
MIQDQNRIELQRRHSVYEEYILDPDEQGLVLPGSLVCIKESTQYKYSSILGSGSYDGILTSQASDIAAAPVLVVLENALLGTSINHPSKPGRVTPVAWAQESSVYLLRCVEGVYRVGDPLFAVQTPNGIYVGTEPTPFMVGMAEESFAVTTAKVDAIDTSNSDYSDWRLNGKTVNLIRTRIRTARLVNIASRLNYTISVSDAGTYNDYTLILTFPSELTDALTDDKLIFSNATGIANTFNKIDDTHYAIDIHVTNTNVSMYINHPEITTSQKPVAATFYPEANWTITPVNTAGVTTALSIIITSNESTVEQYGGLALSDIDVTDFFGTTDTITKITAAQYLVNITATAASTASVTITKPGVVDIDRYVSISIATATIPVAYYGFVTTINSQHVSGLFTGEVTPPVIDAYITSDIVENLTVITEPVTATPSSYDVLFEDANNTDAVGFCVFATKYTVPTTMYDLNLLPPVDPNYPALTDGLWASSTITIDGETWNILADTGGSGVRVRFEW